MNRKKVFISTVPFGEIDDTPIKSLMGTDLNFIINPKNRKLKAAEVAGLAIEADGIIAGTENLRPLIEKSNKLKIISRVGIGLDSVPLQLCKDRNIIVTYTPDAVTMAVAELTIGTMISLSRYTHVADKEIRRNHWNRLQGKRIGKSVIGIIGLGRIGTEVAKLLSVFKPEKILINDIKDKAEVIEKLKLDYNLTIEKSSKENLYQNSDIISLHVPFTKKTNNLINRKVMAQFKKNAFLLNLARGGVVNEQDLYFCLKNKQFAGAAVDCFENEPYHGNLCELDNIIMTQHMGSCSYDCRAQMEIQATKDLIRFFNGSPLKNEVPAEEFEYQGG